VVETDYESLGVDTPEDLARISRLFAAAPVAGLEAGSDFRNDA
jgi:hypothetical protein